MSDRALFYVRVCATAVETLGLFLTAWRTYFRLKIGRFWWEDIWASILLATGIIWVTTYWTMNTSGVTSIVGGWFDLIGFTCIVMSARMSVLFSIIRIIHGPPRLLKFLYACVVFFAGCWTVLVVAKAVQCALDPSWHHPHTSGRSSCPTTAQVTIFQFTTDFIAVSILVIIPLHVLWKVKLPRRRKRMILSIFSSSVVLAFAAVFHMVGQILDVTIVMITGMHTMIAFSILVCNLLVIVTYTYSVLLRDMGSGATDSTEDTSDDDDFTSRARSMSSLTTVDLDASFTGHETGVGCASSEK